MPRALYPGDVACVAVLARRHWAWARRSVVVCSMMVIAIASANLSAAQVRLSNINRMDFSTINQFLAQIRASGEQNWKIAVLGTLSAERSLSGVWPTSIVECGAFNCQILRLESLLNLTLLERRAERRVFQLSDAEKASLQPALDSMTPGSTTLKRLPHNRYVILLK